MKKISLFLVMLCLPSFALAQFDLDNVIKPEEGKPIDIKSENMSIQNGQNLAIFQKNVKVVQGGMKLDSDELKVYSEYNEKTKRSRFKLMQAEGNVNFQSQDKTVRSDKATYDVIAGVLILEGNVALKDSESSLEGKIFRYDVKTGSGEIRNTGSVAGTKLIDKPVAASVDTKTATDKAPSTGRVRAVFKPGEGVKQIGTPVDAIDNFKKEKKQKEALNPANAAEEEGEAATK